MDIADTQVVAVFNQMVECQDCIFWVEDGPIGECHRRSPEANDKGRGKWPRTLPGEGCGEGELPMEDG